MPVSKEHIRARFKKWADKNRDRIRSYATNAELAMYAQLRRLENPTAWKAKRKLWESRNPSKVRQYQQTNYSSHLAARLASAANYRGTHRKEISEYRKWKLDTDANTRIRHNLNSLIRLTALRHGGRKSVRTIEALGCTADFFRGFLEARFRDGMNWSNYGSYWEIDHIIPCAEFDLRDAGQQKQCFHYSNLRPLSKPENRAKSARCPAVHQKELL